MAEPVDPARWPLHGLVRCGYCRGPMEPSRWLAGPRAYQCGFPCARSRADAAGLELMAYRTALAGRPDAEHPTLPPDNPAPLFAEAFRQVVVHGDLSDVRFVRA